MDPQLRILHAKLDEIFPNCTPCAGAFEFALIGFPKIIWEMFLQITSPAGVVYHQIEH